METTTQLTRTEQLKLARKKQLDRVNQIGYWMNENRRSLSTWMNETGMFGEGVRAIYPAQNDRAWSYDSETNVTTIVLEDGSEYVITIQQKK